MPLRDFKAAGNDNLTIATFHLEIVALVIFNIDIELASILIKVLFESCYALE